MTRSITRRQFLGRAAAGGVALSALPALLAACGGDDEGGEAAGGGGGTLRISNWPLYIDVNDETGERPTLAQFTEATGIEVEYIEDINSNEEFFGKIQAPLSQGESIDRDIIVPTAWLAARLLRLEYVEPLNKDLIPNIVNLEETLASPAWDPNRDFSLPWQTYMTGLGWDPERVGGDLTSVEDLLDPSLKGKVTMLNSVEDTVGLFLLAMGSDPTKVDPAAFDEAIAKIQKAVDDGQIRQFTGNDYINLLPRGDAWASIAWSGDIVQLQLDNPNLKFVIPDAGGMTSVDTMVIPTGGNVDLASQFMNFFYDPKIMAQVEAYVNYIPPVKGVREAIAEIDPELAENPLIFPPPEVREELFEYDAEALENTELQEKWQAVIGA